MNRLDQLIATYYPEGVPYRAIGELGSIISGLSGKTKSDFSDGNARFVSYRNVFTNLAVDQEAADFVRVKQGERQNRLRRGDVIFTGSSENVADVGMSSVVLTEPQEPLYLNSFCFALRLHDQDLLVPEFAKYLFRGEAVRAAIRRSANGVTRINLSKQRFKKIRIPLPPLAAQREITEILDSYSRAESELSSALDAESAARQLQQTHLRASVLDRNRPMPLDGSVRLSELVDFTNGKPHERLVSPEGSVALLTARFISTSGKSARWVDPNDALTPARRGDIAMVMSDLPNGRALARCFFVDEDGKYTANQRVCLLRVREDADVSSRWLYHFLDRNLQLLAYDNGQDQTHLKKGQILDISVPVTPRGEQELAARSLDLLDTHVRALVLSLQAEREGRHKQLQYYLDRLLTFEEIPA